MVKREPRKCGEVVTETKHRPCEQTPPDILALRHGAETISAPTPTYVNLPIKITVDRVNIPSRIVRDICPVVTGGNNYAADARFSRFSHSRLFDERTTAKSDDEIRSMRSTDGSSAKLWNSGFFTAIKSGHALVTR